MTMSLKSKREIIFKNQNKIGFRFILQIDFASSSSLSFFSLTITFFLFACQL